MHRIKQHQIQVTFNGIGTKPRSFFLPRNIGKKLYDYATESSENLISASDVLPELKEESTRAAANLRGSRYKEKMTQTSLAKLLQIKQHHLSEMENNKRPIGKEMAKKLAQVFDTDYRTFL